MPATPNLIELCAKEEVAEGGVIKVDKDDLSLAVYHVDGEFFVTDNDCTHGPGSLSDGYLEGHEIECDFHGGCYDIRSGAVTAPPCVVPIRTYVVVAHETAVMIEVPDD